MADTDRRVAKTKRAIRNAFAELLTAKDIDEITIKDIADTADINRKTFYCHYSGVHEVIAEIENELVADFDRALSTLDLDQVLSDPYEPFMRLTAIINSDIDFYGHLMRVNRNSSLTNKLIQAMKDRLMDSPLSGRLVDRNTRAVIVDYAVSGMLSVYRSWFNSDRSQSIEEIARILSTVTFSGVIGMLRPDESQRFSPQ